MMPLWKKKLFFATGDFKQRAKDLQSQLLKETKAQLDIVVS